MKLEEKWKKLQNGSDIRGVSLYWNPDEPVNFTPKEVSILSTAFAGWLSNKTGKDVRKLQVSVGTDSRLSGPALKEAALSALVLYCKKCYDCSIASTPAIFMSCILPRISCDGGIMITASHLPANRNGMKFFTKDGGLEKSDITDILLIASELEESLEDIPTKIKTDDPSIQNVLSKLNLIGEYSKYLVETIRKGSVLANDQELPLSGLKIIVDAGNGAGGFFAKEVLEPLGADTKGSQYLTPDGNFPHHIPNPENPIAMQSIRKAVLESGADFGIIFDTDVDRAGAVDKFGKEINRNRIIALMAAIVLHEHPGTTIVTDSITSSELNNFIENNLGGRHHRFKRGYKNVINEAIRLNENGIESHLAIETSGHGALKENYFMDDGAYLIAKILIKIANLQTQGLTIDSLISDLKEPLEANEFRFSIQQSDFAKYGKNILNDLTNYASKNSDWNITPDNHEGVRISFDKKSGNGWFLLRMSLHDPIMPLNIESNDPNGTQVIGTKLLAFLDGYPDLDTTALKNFCSK